MSSNNRYTPIYKYFQKLRENITGTTKLLKFKKKKWIVLNKRLSLSKPYKFFNHNLYQISRNAKLLKNLYRSQLATKQRLSIYYGKLTNEQIKRLSRLSIIKSKVKNADKDASEFLLKALETRLDTILYRSHFASSMNMARQFITHGNIYVNKKKVCSTNFLIKRGDIIQISKKLHPLVKLNIVNSLLWPFIPVYLEINFKILSIYFVQNVTAKDVVGLFPFWLNFKNIISFYKK
jgi:small subunit ribosomal protein S4